MCRRTSQVHAECHYQEPHNGDDLGTGENEFGFTIDGNGEDVQANDEDDDDGDPRGDVDSDGALPELDDERCGRDFGAESDGAGIPVLKLSE